MSILVVYPSTIGRAAIAACFPQPRTALLRFAETKWEALEGLILQPRYVLILAKDGYDADFLRWLSTDYRGSTIVIA